MKKEEIIRLNTKNIINTTIKNEKLKAVLLGNNFLYGGIESQTPFYVHALTSGSYIQSAYKCIKGGSQITKQLVKQLRKYKVKILKHHIISHLHYSEKGEILYAENQNGEKIYAKNFISNIDIKHTLHLIGENYFPTSLRASASIWLKPKTVESFNHNYYHFRDEQAVWENANYRNYADSYMLSCTESEHHKGFTESFTAITYMDFNEVKEWEHTLNTVANPQERNRYYEEFKRHKAEIFLNRLEEKIPNLRDFIDICYTSSPLSYQDYIGITGGSMYGYRKEANNPMKSFFSPRTKIRNLFLTGQSVNMHGFFGVTIGTFNTCSEILGKDYLN